VAAAVEVAAGEVAVAVAEVAVEVAVVVGTSPRLLGKLILTLSQDGLEVTVIPFATADGDRVHRIPSQFTRASGLA
jgi:hypothetical protein